MKANVEALAAYASGERVPMTFEELVSREVERQQVRREAARRLAELDAGESTEPELRVWTLAELLADPTRFDLPAAVVPRLAWPGRATLFAAQEKLGKSTLATAAAGAVSRGGEFLGEAAGLGVVLWCTEEHVADAARRLRDFDADPERVLLLQWGVDPISEIRAEVAARRPALVILDTLAAVAERAAPESGSASQWATIMRPLVRMAREFGCSLLILHHAKKGEGGGYRDSSEIAAAVDCIIEMTGSPTGNVRTLAYRGRYGRGSFAVRLTGRRYEVLAEDADDTSIESAILDFLRLHPGSGVRAIRKGVGGRAETIGEALARMVAEGRIEDGTGPRGGHSYRVSSGSGLGNRLAAAVVPAEVVPVVPDQWERGFERSGSRSAERFPVSPPIGGEPVPRRRECEGESE